MKNEKKFVIDTLKTVYGVTDLAEELFISDEDPEQVDDDKLKALFVDLDKKKIKGIQTTSFDKGAQTREKKLKSDIEAMLKTKFGITDTDFTDGDDLDNLVDYIAETRKPGKGALTEEELLKHPAVVRLRNQHQTELQNKETEFNNKLTAKEQEQAKKVIKNTISAKAVTKLNTRNPILPTDEAKAQRRIKKDLIDELEAYDWMEVDGKQIPLDDKGEQLQNDNGVLLTADDLIDQIINDNFEFAAAQSRSSAGGRKGEQSKEGKQQPEKEAYTGALPANDKEYLEMINDRKKYTVEQRASISRQYKKKKGIV